MLILDKKEKVSQLKSQFTESTATVITEYRGLSVKALSDLRQSMGAGTKYVVAKNTLIKIAAQEAGVQGLEDLFQGPTALAFIQGDVVESAKALKKFAKNNKDLVIKGGYMEGEVLSAPQIEEIAELETREVLLAKVAGAMKGNLSKAAGLFAAHPTQVARLISALIEKQS